MSEREPRIRNRWWIVVGCTVGMIFSTGPLIQFSFGVFIKPVSEAFHADRGRASFALLVALCVCALLTPLVGRLVDRFGVRRIGAPCIALFAISFGFIGLASTSVWLYIGCYALAGIFGAGQTTLIYAKAIAAAFDSKRGLALGIAISGVGLGTALIPRLAQHFISILGWRHAYLALGAVTLMVALPALLLFVREGGPAASRIVTRDIALQGLTGSEALRSRLFWTLATAFFLVAVALAGVMAHIVPMMTDRGVPAETASLALSSGGIALIAGRLIAGYILDFVFAPFVALFFFALPLLGIGILLTSSSVALSVVAGILIGTSLGAEVDLIAYLQSRYFGLRRFGEIYGYLLAIFMVGSGVGPFELGVAYVHFGNYSAALAGLGVCLACACASMLTFPAYAFGNHDRSATASLDRREALVERG
ncbi:MAG: MFS transporter [Steroidobacteraceae bacterium]